MTARMTGSLTVLFWLIHYPVRPLGFHPLPHPPPHNHRVDYHRGFPAAPQAAEGEAGVEEVGNIVEPTMKVFKD